MRYILYSETFPSRFVWLNPDRPFERLFRVAFLKDHTWTPDSPPLLNAILCGDQCPAHDPAANRTPAAEPFVDLGRELRPAPERSLGFDLRVRNVADRNPARRFAPIRLATSPRMASPISETSPSPCSLIMIVRGVEAEEIRRHDRGRQIAVGDTVTIFGGRVLSFGSCAGVRLEQLFRRGEVFATSARRSR